MRKLFCTASLIVLLAVVSVTAQQLSPKWEELTAADFVNALQQSRATCALPFGILEKHGPAGVLGTDLINVRYSTLKAIRDEYVIVFPEYYVGQIFEAKHQPGTVAYSTHLQLEMLQETVAEMARNQIGELTVGALRSFVPGSSNDAEFFPGMVKKWGLGGMITTDQAPTGRSAGSWAWAGLANTYFWVDPTRRVAGLILTQILPFCDAAVLDLFDRFERAIYATSG